MWFILIFPESIHLNQFHPVITLSWLKPIHKTFVAQFYSRSDMPAGAQQVQITQNISLTDVNFSLRKGGILNGYVNNTQGAGIEGAKVYIEENAANGRSYQVVSGPDGFFQASGIPNGTWRVHAVHDRYLPVDFYNELYTISEGITTATKTFTFEAGGYISGSLFSSLPVNSGAGYPGGSAFLFGSSSTHEGNIIRPNQSSFNILEPSIINTTMPVSYVSGPCKTGKWKMIFTPYSRGQGLNITDAMQPVEGLGWNFIGGDSLFLSAPELNISPMDTLQNIPLTLRKGYSVFGKVHFSRVQSILNFSVTAFVKQNESFLMVSQGYSQGGDVFELPGLIDNEEYFLEVYAAGYQSQFWAPGGTNTIKPENAYKFNSTNFVPINIDIIDNPTDGTIGPDKPFSLWIQRDTISPVLNWSCDNALALDTFKVYAYDKSGKVTLLKTIPGSSTTGGLLFRDTRVQDSWSEYVVTGKGQNLLLRSNIERVDPYHYDSRLNPLWIDVYKMRWGIQIDWGNNGTFTVSDQDSVGIYRRVGLEPWKLISLRSGNERSIDDHEWESRRFRENI